MTTLGGNLHKSSTTPENEEIRSGGSKHSGSGYLKVFIILNIPFL